MYDYDLTTEGNRSSRLRTGTEGCRPISNAPEHRSFYENTDTSASVKNPYEGKPIQFSGSLSKRIRESFGINTGELKLRESAQVAEMGMRATAQGNAIRFAPGALRPDTREGLETIGHELSHVRAQAEGKVRPDAPGGDILHDAEQEAAGDRIGKEFASGMPGNAQPVSLGGIDAHSSPVQGKPDDDAQWNNNSLHEDDQEFDNPAFAGGEDIHEEQALPPVPAEKSRKKMSRKQRRAARKAALTALPSGAEVIELGKHNSIFRSSSGYNVKVREVAAKVANLKDILENGNRERDDEYAAELAGDIQARIAELMEDPLCSGSKREYWAELSATVGISSFQRRELHEKTSTRLSEINNKISNMPLLSSRGRARPGDKSSLSEQTDYVRSVGVPNMARSLGLDLVNDLLAPNLKTDDEVLNKARVLAGELNQVGKKRGFFMKAVVGERDQFDADYAGFIETYQDTIRIMKAVCAVFATSNFDDDIDAAAKISNYIANLQEADLFAHRLYDEFMFNPDIDWDQIKGKKFIDLMSAVDLLRVDTSAGMAKKLGSGQINTVYKIRAEGMDKVLKPGKRDLAYEYGFKEKNVNGVNQRTVVDPYNEQDFYTQTGRSGHEMTYTRDLFWKVSDKHLNELQELHERTADAGSKQRLEAEIEGIKRLMEIDKRRVETLRGMGVEEDKIFKGHPYSVVEGANTSKRDVAVSRVSKLLGFNNMSNGELALSSSGRLALVMNMAKGQDAESFFLSNTGADNPNSLDIGDYKLQLEFIKMSIVDVITGTTDRHNFNFFINKTGAGGQAGHEYQIQGIDSDLNFSDDSEQVDAKGSMADHHDKALWITSIEGGIPYLTKSMAEKIRSLNESGLRAALTGMVTDSNIDATLERLQILQSKIPPGVDPNPGNGMIPVIDERDLSNDHDLAKGYANEVMSAPGKYSTAANPTIEGNVVRFTEAHMHNMLDAPSPAMRMRMKTKWKEHILQQIRQNQR